MELVDLENDYHLHKAVGAAYQSYLGHISPAYSQRQRRWSDYIINRRVIKSIGLDDLQFTEGERCKSSLTDDKNGKVTINRNFFLSLPEEDDEGTDVNHRPAFILLKSAELYKSQSLSSYTRGLYMTYAAVGLAVLLDLQFLVTSIGKDNNTNMQITSLFSLAFCISASIFMQRSYNRIVNSYNQDIMVENTYGTEIAKDLINQEIEAGGYGRERLEEYNKARSTLGR